MVTLWWLTNFRILVIEGHSSIHKSISYKRPAYIWENTVLWQEAYRRSMKKKTMAKKMISFEIKCIQSFQKRYFVVLFYRIAPISHNSYGEWEQHFGIDRNLLTRPIILHMKLWNLACPENTQSLKSHAPQGYSHFLSKWFGVIHKHVHTNLNFLDPLPDSLL